MELEDPTTGAPAAESPDAGVDADISRVAALGDPLRRALYRYVAAQAEPVNRDQAAEGLGVARHIAKFHLDRLVADGLLDVEFARPPGRSGPGAGRPAKFFRRAARDVSVTLPSRRYDLAGRLLAEAVTESQRDDVPIGNALARATHEWGRSLGHEAKRLTSKRPSRSAALAATSEVLSECGYEPRPDAGGLVLANCPFHVLARDYTDLVCGMNLELIDGMLTSFDGCRLEALLDPAPDRCCVRIAASS